MPSVDRRRLLIRAAALAAGAMAPAGWTTAWARTRLPEYPFRLGVASGEPRRTASWSGRGWPSIPRRRPGGCRPSRSR